MVKLYYCNTEKFEHLYEKALPLLTEKRRAKTEGYTKKEDKLCSLAVGLMLKKVLNICDDRQISYNEHGKPFFEHGSCFGISHSKNIAVLAVCKNNIGVDIETANGISEAVMHRCFTEEEREYALLSTDNALQIWTAKEAVLKLLGTGFSLSPKSFNLLPFEEKHTVNGVTMGFFTAKIENYPITLAYEGEEKEFEILEFQPEDLVY